VPAVLASLGREHDPADVVTAVAAVEAVGFASWNLDVIYGAAGETAEDWRRTLDGVLALEPPHVSAYALTVEPGTPLADDPARAPDDDVQAEAYLAAEAAFTGAGLANYEISNWARPGHECRHNLLYWSAGEYRGFGCAAHSHAGGRRWWNVRTPERYVAAVEEGRSPEAAGEELAPAERRLEALQLSLRTRAGVPAGALAPADREELDGLLVPQGDRLVLSVPGRLLANEVAVRLRVPDEGGPRPFFGSLPTAAVGERPKNDQESASRRRSPPVVVTSRRSQPPAAATARAAVAPGAGGPGRAVTGRSAGAQAS
jgi:coproporphyrinogen III oxidase-like Fe-S oxidoreductase